MTGPGRDWDKELADIDKIIAKTPPAQLAAQSGGGPPAAGAPAGPPARASSGSAPVGRKAALSTWLRVLLGVALAVGMTQWPYFHACGPALFLYLGSIGVVGLAGLWSAITSWRRRMGLAHTISLLVLLAGAVLAASEVLPRIGYAKRAATWLCP